MSFKEKLFQPFQRLHSTKEVSGFWCWFGYSSKNYPEAWWCDMGESEIGKGSVFYFTIK